MKRGKMKICRKTAPKPTHPSTRGVVSDLKYERMKSGRKISMSGKRQISMLLRASEPVRKPVANPDSGSNNVRITAATLLPKSDLHVDSVSVRPSRLRLHYTTKGEFSYE